jgi:tetratricopeptide (TPR) repeat protein
MMSQEVLMPLLRPWRFVVATALAIGVSAPVAAQMSRAEALKALEQPAPAARLMGVERLAEVGIMADAERLVPSLRDAAPAVHERAASALWQIWSRSGDPLIDELFARGVSQMAAAALSDALSTFDEIVRRRPAFAEGWNKRATVYFLLGRYAESLKDVDEVLQRNRHHFGALSGAEARQRAAGAGVLPACAGGESESRGTRSVDPDPRGARAQEEPQHGLTESGQTAR